MRLFNVPKKSILLSISTILIIAGFQNCTQTSFKSNSIDSSSSSQGSGEDAQTQIPISGPPAENNPSLLELKMCANVGCLETGNQKLFFTDVVGTSLTVEIVSKSSALEAVIKVVDENSSREAQLKLKISSTGYVFASPLDQQKPWLCLDSSVAADAVLAKGINCLSPVLTAGTRQKYQRTSLLNYLSSPASETLMMSAVFNAVAHTKSMASLAGIPDPEVPSQVVFSNTFIVGKHGMLSKQLVISDHLGRGNMISNLFNTVLGIGGNNVGIKVSLRDNADGRYLALDLLTRNGMGVAQELNASTNFYLSPSDPSRPSFDSIKHGYFCFDHTQEPLAILTRVKNSVSREVLNCFGSPRFTVLENYASELSSGTIPIKNSTAPFSQLNMEPFAVGNENFLAKPILVAPAQ